jgi:isoleucyl-tRNA synthetase
MDKWESIRVLLNDVNMCIERARAQKEVGASQECRVIIHSEDSNMKSVLKAIQGDDKFYSTSKTTDGMDDLRFIFGTSQVLVVDSIDELKELAPTFNILDQESESGMSIGVTKALGKKCDRCWYYSESVGEDHDHDDICLRCADVIKKENLIDKVLKNTVV